MKNSRFVGKPIPFICWWHMILFLSIIALSPRQVSAQTIQDAENQYCDEAKCRGSRIHPWVDDDTEFTCWVSVDANITQDGILDDTYYTSYGGHYCADGYEGRIVESVAPQEIDGEQRYWFTCCTPGYTGEVKQTCDDWTCSSPDWEGGGNCWADGFQEPMTCGTTERRFPRFTGMKSLIYVQFLCCDSPQVDDSFMQELLLARIIWMALSGITFCVCCVFIAGILSSTRARAQGYNLYLVFLAAPDAVANLLILIRCGLTIPGVPVDPNIHIILASFEYFYAASNMWLNGVIVSQIHHVLRKSRKFEKVPPPSPRLVCYQAGGTYMFSLFAFGWAFFLYHEGLNVFSLTRVVTVWILTRVVMVAPPLFYVTYVCIDVWYNKLLPRSGRTRVVSLYFLRVIIVFLLTWVPYFIIYEIAWNITHSRWMVHSSYYLGSVQGCLSVFVALSKPDVKRAVLRFISCQCFKQEETETVTEGGTTAWGRTTSLGFSLIGTRGRYSTNQQDGSVVLGGSDGDPSAITAVIDNSKTSRVGAEQSVWEMDDEWSTTSSSRDQVDETRMSSDDVGIHIIEEEEEEIDGGEHDDDDDEEVGREEGDVDNSFSGVESEGDWSRE